MKLSSKVLTNVPRFLRRIFDLMGYGRRRKILDGLFISEDVKAKCPMEFLVSLGSEADWFGQTASESLTPWLSVPERVQWNMIEFRGEKRGFVVMKGASTNGNNIFTVLRIVVFKYTVFPGLTWTPVRLFSSKPRPNLPGANHSCSHRVIMGTGSSI